MKKCPFCSDIITNENQNSCLKCNYIFDSPLRESGQTLLTPIIKESIESSLSGTKRNIADEIEDDIIDDAISLLESKLNVLKREFVLSQRVPFITQVNDEAAEWSCGYRNIQMLCHSLSHLSTYCCRLFHGDGNIPGIQQIQAWIEIAWSNGFDVEVIMFLNSFYYSYYYRLLLLSLGM